MTNIIYFSSVSENVHRFIQNLGLPATRLPLYAKEETVRATEPYVLVVPTYGGGHPKTAVPKQVIKFLNVPENRALIRGVISSGNTNFGSGYALGAKVVAQKCGVPVLYKFEVFGTPEDVENVRTIMKEFNFD